MVGGPKDKDRLGGVWAFNKADDDDAMWVQSVAGPLVGTKYTGTVINHGSSVSLSADGTILASGGSRDLANRGAVWVFQYVGGAWTEVAGPLVGKGYKQGLVRQGWSVSLSADGTTLASGAPYNEWKEGAVWIFRKRAGGWAQVAGPLVGLGSHPPAGNASSSSSSSSSLKASSSSSLKASLLQGCSVSLSADGATVAWGAPEFGGGVGAAWVYELVGSVWTHMAGPLVGSSSGSLAAPGGSLARQGWSVRLSGDGGTLAVGGPSYNGGEGGVWIYKKDGKMWREAAGPLVGATSTLVGGNQGSAVSLSWDGTILASGATGAGGGRGAVWVFKGSGSGSTWQQVPGPGLDPPNATAGAGVGADVQLSWNGRLVAAGGPGQSGNVGGAWVFATGLTGQAPPVPAAGSSLGKVRQAGIGRGPGHPCMLSACPPCGRQHLFGDGDMG